MEKDDPVFIYTYDDGAPLIFYLGTMPQAARALAGSSRRQRNCPVKTTELPFFMYDI